MGCVESVDDRRRQRHQRLEQQPDTIYVQNIIDENGNVIAQQVVGSSNTPPQNGFSVGQSYQSQHGSVMYVQQGQPQQNPNIRYSSNTMQGVQSVPMQSQPVQSQPVSYTGGTSYQAMSPNGIQYIYYQPFISNRTPPNLTGNQRALLIGCNYFGTRAELRGCITDCRNVYQLLTQTFGWSPSSIRMLTDDGAGGYGPPTKANIFQNLRWLAGDGRCKPGDVMFLLFSGHGAQKEDPHGYEEDGMNETILPCDFKNAGMITDDQLNDMVVKPLPEGSRLTCLMDSCHSGTGLDLPYTWTKGRGWKEDVLT